MAIRTVEEIMELVRNRVGDDTSDASIAFIEDISDTLNDLDLKARNETHWETQYRENDEQWRKRYKERFYNTIEDQETETEESEKDIKKLTYEDLFKEEI